MTFCYFSNKQAEILLSQYFAGVLGILREDGGCCWCDPKTVDCVHVAKLLSGCRSDFVLTLDDTLLFIFPNLSYNCDCCWLVPQPLWDDDAGE